MSVPAVGYLLKKFPRLSETFILNELLGLERCGVALDVFSRRAPDLEPRHPQLADLRAEVIALPAADPRTLFAQAAAANGLRRRIERALEDAPRWSHRRFRALLAEAVQLQPILQRRGIAHLHVHFATDSAIVAALARELGGPSYSVTLHAKDIYRDGVSFERLERIIGGATFAVTVCDANVEHLAGRLSPGAMAKVRRLYNGIDLDRFHLGDGARDRDHVLAVGRLIEKKGFDVLLRALAALEERGVHARATLAGDGDRRPELEALARELGLGDRVLFAGALDQSGIHALMARATVFCLPCVVGADGNQDALPTVLLEALASGLPAISTPVGGVPEILERGAGVLVPSGDAAATAEALVELLGSESRRSALARDGRRRAELLFDATRNATVLAGWLRQSIEGAGAAGPAGAVAGARARGGSARERKAARAARSRSEKRVAATERGRDVARKPRVASINQDPGIGPHREKGAAVHLAALRRALRDRGAEVVELDEPDESRLRARLEEARREAPFVLIYERYALGRSAGAEVAGDWGVPFLLEVNAPLAEEERRWRSGSRGDEEASRRDAVLFAAARRVLAVSSGVADYARRRGAREEAIEVVPNAVDPARFEPRSGDDATRGRLVPAGRFAVGFHGRLRPWHGFELLVRAVERLLERGAPIHLVLVGRGDFAPLLSGRIPQDRVTAVDWVPHDEVGRYVASFDALPLTYPPELPCYFSPLKLREAMACGVVPIVPDLGDLARSVRHGVDGLVYRAGDCGGLAAAIERLVTDAAEKERLGGAARRTALEATWDDVAARVLVHAATSVAEPQPKASTAR
jgi:glycosyltransferase involved in cell wall biosynthesis